MNTDIQDLAGTLQENMIYVPILTSSTKKTNISITILLNTSL